MPRVRFDILLAMADAAIERYRDALRAWATHDLDLAAAVAARRGRMDLADDQLVEALLANRRARRRAGARSVRMVAGQALDRIADHAAILGRRVRYLITGDPAHLAAEVR